MGDRTYILMRAQSLVQRKRQELEEALESDRNARGLWDVITRTPAGSEPAISKQLADLAVVEKWLVRQFPDSGDQVYRTQLSTDELYRRAQSELKDPGRAQLGLDLFAPGAPAQKMYLAAKKSIEQWDPKRSSGASAAAMLDSLPVIIDAVAQDPSLAANPKASEAVFDTIMG